MRKPVLVPGRRLRGVMLLPLAALLLFLASSCYTLTAEDSWIRIQNMGSAPATITINYVDGNGQTINSQTCPAWGVCPYLVPGAGFTFSERDNGGLPGGFAGSAVITSDQPIAVLLAKNAGDPGSYRTAGDVVALSAGTGELFLPLISNRDGDAQNWDSRFAIQNMGTTTACVTLVYTANGTDDEISRDSGQNPATPQPGCSKGGLAIAPGGTLFRSPSDMGVGPSFTGSVRVELTENDQGTSPSQQSIVATADVYSNNSPQIASYAGLTADDMGTSLVLPLIERNADGQWSTNFEIMNSDPTKPANVSIRIDGWDGGNNFVSKTASFSVRASRQCFQDSDWANCLNSGDTLPQGFHDGTAWVNSDQPIGIIVARGSNQSSDYVSYRGLRTDRAGQQVYLPLVDKDASTAANRTGWNSWVRIMVVDGGPANIRIRYIDPSLPWGEVAYDTSMYRTATFIQPWEQGLPAGFSGSMVVESDRPIVALADVTVGNFGGDPDLMYEGVSP
jgi:hypothetical protein